MTGAIPMTNFDDFLDSTLRVEANPEPLADFEQRLTARLSIAASLAERSARRSARRSAWRSAEQGTLFQPIRRERSSPAFFWALAAHAVALVLIGYLVRQHTALLRPTLPVRMVALDAPPPKALPRATTAGGGGGQRGPTPVTRGAPPKFAERQIVPPSAPPLVEPKIRMEPTIEVQRDLKMLSSLPQIGVANSPLVGMSMGNGRGNGMGGGNGSGLGPGSGGNTGGGPRRIGGGVSAPVLLYSVEPEFSEEARKAKLMGNVLVNLWVDQNGNPTHVRVLRGVGMGLDEKAVAAVRQYRFRPALENGRPVTVEMNVEVLFQIF